MRTTTPTRQLAPWPDAAEAYAAQSTTTCDHGHLLWQACRRCGVGAYDPYAPTPAPAPRIDQEAADRAARRLAGLKTALTILERGRGTITAGQRAAYEHRIQRTKDRIRELGGSA